MVDVVKAPLDVSLDKPLCPCPPSSYLGQCRVAASSGAEAVGAVGELRLVVGFQDHPENLLEQLVRPRRDAERALLPARFGNAHPSCGRPPIALMTAGGDERVG